MPSRGDTPRRASTRGYPAACFYAGIPRGLPSCGDTPRRALTRGYPAACLHGGDTPRPAFMRGYPAACLHAGIPRGLPSCGDTPQRALTRGYPAACLHAGIPRGVPSCGDTPRPAFMRGYPAACLHAGIPRSLPSCGDTPQLCPHAGIPRSSALTRGIPRSSALTRGYPAALPSRGDTPQLPLRSASSLVACRPCRSLAANSALPSLSKRSPSRVGATIPTIVNGSPSSCAGNTSAGCAKRRRPASPTAGCTTAPGSGSAQLPLPAPTEAQQIGRALPRHPAHQPARDPSILRKESSRFAALAERAGRDRGGARRDHSRGSKVFEVSQIYAGPYAGQTLADLGADVVKCEPPGGEAVRLWGQFAPGESKDCRQPQPREPLREQGPGVRRDGDRRGDGARPRRGQAGRRRPPRTSTRSIQKATPSPRRCWSVPALSC